MISKQLMRLRHFASGSDWNGWLSHGRASWVQILWFVSLLMILAYLDGTTNAVWLVPPFAASLTILLLLPTASIAQPIPVVAGPTLAACVGTAASLWVHGPFYAVLAAGVMLVVLPRLKIYHPPGVALAMYPLLLNTTIYFPFVVVLPFVLVAVVTCAVFSRVSPSWAAYPLPLRRHDG